MLGQPMNVTGESVRLLLLLNAVLIVVVVLIVVGMNRRSYSFHREMQNRLEEGDGLTSACHTAAAAAAVPSLSLSLTLTLTLTLPLTLSILQRQAIDYMSTSFGPPRKKPGPSPGPSLVPALRDQCGAGGFAECMIPPPPAT